MTALVLVGRSSSHFTRVARMFALELEVAHTFQPVHDLMSEDPATFAGNPGLKIPVLVEEDGPRFGVENIARALTRRSGKRSEVVLRGDVDDRVVANVEELTLHVMSSDVTLIISTMMADGREPPKVRKSLEHSLRQLDRDLEGALASLPAERSLSFLEVALHCAVTHLPFRKVADVTAHRNLSAFAERYGKRPSAAGTEYRFDSV